jgi:hypothetical protein
MTNIGVEHIDSSNYVLTVCLIPTFERRCEAIPPGMCMLILDKQ